MNNDLNGLIEPFKSKVILLIQKITETKLPMRLFETRRSNKRSQELFEIGRRFDAGAGLWTVVDESKIVTKAHAGESPHNWGVAADFVLDTKNPWDTSPESMNTWHAFGKLADECDLIWGGSWTGFKDLPHVEMKQWTRFRPNNWRSVVSEELK
jgi:peptidoglycan L-alanyl-D-glutamate endopeptidase CwlK